MPRIPTISDRSQLAPADQPVWDRITQSRGRVVGPFAALLHSPPLAERTGALGAYVRFESVLDGATRELVILAVARTFDCRFEWAAHAVLARKEGVREQAIAAIRDRRPAALQPAEAQVVEYVRRLLADHRVPEDLFRALEQRLGRRGVVELTASAGYYAMIACTLNAFEIEPGPDADLLPV
jgi:4-carboxymuconolactone decarboxylase